MFGRGLNDPKFRSMLILCQVGLWSTLPWGFTSFSSVYLQEEEGLTVTEVGYLLPCMGVAQVVAMISIGAIGRTVSHKLIVIASILLMIAGCFSTVFLSKLTGDALSCLILGYTLFGFGFAATLVLPFRQIAMYFEKMPQSYGWWYTGYETCRGLLSPGGARVLMMICTAQVKGEWGWRLPWLIALIVQGVNIFLVLSFCKFKQPTAVGKKSKKVSSKATEFYCNPVSLPLFISCAFAAVAFISMSTWTPTIAKAKFGEIREVYGNTTTIVKEGYTTEHIQGILSIASFLGYPIGVPLAAGLVMKFKTARASLKYAWLFMICAAIFKLCCVLAKDFYVYAVFVVLFAAFAMFPFSYYKTLPQLLEFPQDVKLFALSRFALMFIFFGDVVASLAVTQIMQRWGPDATIKFIFGCSAAAAVVWFPTFVMVVG